MTYLGTLSNLIDQRKDALLGFLDYRYMPFALGDTLTWLMNLQIAARERGIDRIVQLIHVDPEDTICRLQPHINAQNYRKALTNLFPAFLCSPLTDTIHVVENKHTYWGMLASAALGRKPSWPGIRAQLTQNIDYCSHKRINAYFERAGELPLLCAPRGYAALARGFRDRYLHDRFVVTVNIRQRKTKMDLAAIHRDSPLDAWVGFFERVERSHPEVVFAILGDYHEWDRKLFAARNIIVPRTFGYGLGMDLALLFGSDLFMGTSSGFSAAATFSELPYVITNFEHSAASFVGIPVGTQRYPFAKPWQTLCWHVETTDRLMEHFDGAYTVLKSCREMQRRSA